jgi:tRNA A-37 threonylcarbamoyl transferase component Bud32
MTEQEIFLAVLDKNPAERAMFLDEACAGDAELRRGVETLLRLHTEPHRFLDVPALEQLAAGCTAPENAAADLSFLAPPSEPGSLGRLDHYEILEVVGRGGTGVVLRARDSKLMRIVAIKVLAPSLTASGIARQRFAREARAAAAVRDEHVIDIHAVRDDAPVPYLVMEYIDGCNLETLLRNGGPLEVKEILRIGMQVASGLAAAHKHGLIHRDVKPANILLENGVQRVKLTDFGLARAADDARLTQTGLIAGTPYFMAPEQARGENVDHRADLFSLGSVLYALSTGRVPFRASGTLAVLRRVCDEPADSVQKINPRIPDGLAAIIEKLHAKKADDRFHSASEVAELLGKHLAQLQHPTLAPMPPLPSSALRGSSLGYRVGDERARAWARHWIKAAVVLLCLFGGLAATEATGVTHLTATVLRILRPEGILVVEVDDPDVKVSVDAEGGLVITGAGPHEIHLHPGIYRLQATKDGKPIKNEVVTISRGKKQVVSVRLEATPVVGEIRRFEGHIEPVHALAVSRDGRRAITGGWDKTVRVWDLDKGRETRSWSVRDLTRRANHAIYAVALSPNKKFALAGSRQGAVWLWDVETGQEQWRHDIPLVNTVGVTSVAFSPDGQSALVGGGDGCARLWQISPWKEVRCLKHSQKEKCWSVCFSPDGGQAVTSGGTEPGESGAVVRLWNLQTGEEVHCFKGHREGLWCTVISPDGRYILSAGFDSVLRLWDTQTGTEIRRFNGHTEHVTCVAFSPDGRRVLSTSNDKTIRLWDVESGQELHRFVDREVTTRCVAFIPPGRQALSGDFHGRVRLWQLLP